MALTSGSMVIWNQQNDLQKRARIMAPRSTSAQKPATPKPADDAPAFDFSSVAVAESTLPKIAKESKPNPLLPHAQKSLDEGVALMLADLPESAVKEAENHLRRAARYLDCGVRIRLEEKGNGVATVHFTFKANKRAINYTAKQVREWAVGQGVEHAKLFPRVDKEVNAAYRKAHGLK